MNALSSALTAVRCWLLLKLPPASTMGKKPSGSGAIRPRSSSSALIFHPACQSSFDVCSALSSRLR
ncbi:MAG: hypothetical protein J5602_02880 [Clostridia bacterium]|nr:hypothetical protein [Clostridia bacterium]